MLGAVLNLTVLRKEGTLVPENLQIGWLERQQMGLPYAERWVAEG